MTHGIVFGSFTESSVFTGDDVFVSLGGQQFSRKDLDLLNSLIVTYPSLGLHSEMDEHMQHASLYTADACNPNFARRGKAIHLRIRAITRQASAFSQAFGARVSVRSFGATRYYYPRSMQGFQSTNSEWTPLTL